LLIGLFRHDRWAPSGLHTGQRSVTTPTSSRGTIFVFTILFCFLTILFFLTCWPALCSDSYVQYWYDGFDKFSKVSDCFCSILSAIRKQQNKTTKQQNKTTKTKQNKTTKQSSQCPLMSAIRSNYLDFLRIQGHP